MKVVKHSALTEGMRQLQYLHDNLIGIVDATGAIRRYTQEELTFVSGIKVKLSSHTLLPIHASFCPHGGFVASILPDATNVGLWSLHDKKGIATLSWHKADVTAVQCDPVGHYVATGDHDGHTFVWGLATGQLTAALPPHHDTIMAIAFSANGQRIATAGADRLVQITNLSSMAQPLKLRGVAATPKFLAFLPNFHLLSIDHEGGALIWDTHKGKIIARLPRLSHPPVAIALSQDGLYCFVALQTHVVVLYDLEDRVLIPSPLIRHTHPIKALAYDDEHGQLFIGDDQGSVSIAHTGEDRSLFAKAVTDKAISDAYKILEQNPTLRHHISVAQLEIYWQQAFQEAASKLEALQPAEAKKILAPFMVVESKRLEAQNLFKDFKEITKFKLATETKKYVLVYAMVTQFPTLKMTTLYRHVEKEWSKAYATARDIMAKNGSKEMISETFSRFRGITQKWPFIQMLLEEKDMVRIFLSKIAQKEYPALFDLAERKPFLKELDEYKNLMKRANVMLTQAQRELKEGLYIEALKKARFLESFTTFKEETAVIIEQANIHATLMDAKSRNDSGKILALIRKYPFLEESAFATQLQKEWYDAIRQAEDRVTSGSVQALNEILSPFRATKEHYEKIMALYSACYRQQLAKGIMITTIPDDHVIRAFERYFAMFGCDDALVPLIVKTQSQRGLMIDSTQIALPTGLPATPPLALFGT